MSNAELFIGEDQISAPCPDDAKLQTLAAAFRQSGHWAEVVRGLCDLTVTYDPATLPAVEAEILFRKLWDMPIGAVADTPDPALLSVLFDNTPDRSLIAHALSEPEETIPAWLCARTYRITMMGFQPGFVYLEDLDGDALPTLPRLETPRQHVAAGSIGFLGRRACIYALDGPGGWPIIGRVTMPLFRRDDPQPFLLQPGQIVRFLMP
jgi:KipI family sensor histidine kinase inhibitor